MGYRKKADWGWCVKMRCRIVNLTVCILQYGDRALDYFLLSCYFQNLYTNFFLFHSGLFNITYSGFGFGMMSYAITKF